MSKLTALIHSQNHSPANRIRRASKFKRSFKPRIRRLDLESSVLENVLCPKGKNNPEIRTEKFYSYEIKKTSKIFSPSKKDFLIKSALIFGSEVEEIERARLLDWMIQVFRVLKKSSDQTFFQAIRIIDHYFLEKERLNLAIKKDDVHLLSLGGIFLASKLEDVVPVKMYQIV